MANTAMYLLPVCCFTKTLKYLLNSASQFTSVEAGMFFLFILSLASKGKTAFQYSLDNMYLLLYQLVLLEVYLVMNQAVIVH